MAAATARLRRRIKIFPTNGDVRLFVGMVKLLVLCNSDGRVAASAGLPVRCVSLPACRGEGFPVIPGCDCFIRVAAVVGDSRCVFRSSVLGPATADFFASSALGVSVADFRSTFMIHAGGESGRWLLQQIHDWRSTMKTGGSLCSAPVAPSGRSRRRRRKSSGGEKDCVVISFLSRVASVKNRRCTVPQF